MDKKNTGIIAGYESWRIESDCVRLNLTREGGQMAPVEFFAGSGNPVSPYYVAPWAEEGPSDLPPGLGPLRGDFFCLPFGGDNSWNGENHPPHGETACGIWNLEKLESSGGSASLSVSMETQARPGRVEKTVELRAGENNIYLTHRISGFAGPASLGHHVIFRGDSPKLVSTAPVRFGITDTWDTFHSSGEYRSLASGERFSSLDRIPTIWKDPAFSDCSIFPAREGFIDILQIFPEKAPLVWSSVSCPEEGWLWYSLRRYAAQPSTVIWMENRGRHQVPWNGRNSCIGIEDVCSHLADGLAVSAEENSINSCGIPTVHILDPGEIFEIRYLQGLVRIGRNFGKAVSIVPGSKHITIESENGRSVEVSAEPGFLDANSL